MDLESMYQEIILDHYKRPQRKGLASVFDAESHHVNPTCGDEITLRLVATSDGVGDVTWDGIGCSISQASASVMSELMVGRSVGDALLLGEEFLQLMQSKGEGQPNEDRLGDGVAFVGVAKYPARIKCALLGWMAFKDALAQAVAAQAAGQKEE
jgi:nitrogen fixation protein NifU and related proteins